MGSLVRHATSVGLIIALLVALSCTGITDEELVCEQAVSKVSDCCSDIDTRLLPCVETAGGCASGEARATIDTRGGECILASSCDALRAAHKCEAIAEYARLAHVNKDRARLTTEVCR